MSWRRSAVALAASVPVIALLGFGMTRDPRAIPSPLPGRDAPAFALPVLARGDVATAPDTVVLAAYRGKAVVLNFWASWCLACRSEHAALSTIAAAYRDSGVYFFGVTYNDRPESSKRWIAEMGGQSYPSLFDPGARTAIDYGLYGVPETFFIAPDGRVAYKHVGPVTEEMLVQRIAELRARPGVRTPRASAIQEPVRP